MSNERVKITLIKSLIGRLAKHKATVHCLGLKKMWQSVVVEDTPIVRGRINQVSYLLRIESASEQAE